MDYYEIGQRIRKMRKAKCISQEQLAEAAEISVTHMNHIETGNTKLSLPVLINIAIALEVRTDDLLYEQSRSTVNTISEEIRDLLDSCDAKQAKVLCSVLKSAKQAMDAFL